jgi:hypothetical protein
MEDPFAAPVRCQILRIGAFLCATMLLSSPVSFAQPKEELATLRWHQWDEGIAAAQVSGKWMLVDVYTTWCQYTEQEWAKLLEVRGYPMTLVIDQKFQIVARLSGYVDPARFIRFLKFIRGKYGIDGLSPG